jgi:hypothetical protein
MLKRCFDMAPPRSASGRAAGSVALIAASVALHAMVIGGLAGPGAGFQAAAPAEQAPVQVVMLRPSAAAEPGVAPAAAAPEAYTPRPRPKPAAPRPAPVARPAPAAVAPPPPADVVAAARPDAEGAPAVAVAVPIEFPASDVDMVETGFADAVGSGIAGGPGAAEPGAVATAGIAPQPDSHASVPPQAEPSPVATASPAPALAADPPRPPLPALPASRSQRFRVYWGDFTEQHSVARLSYHLTHDGERYRIRTEGEAEGLISLVYSGTLIQESTGRLGPDGLEPLRYAEQRGKRAERAVEFDPAAHRLLPSGGVPPLAVPPGTQDRLSVFYQIGLMARSDPASFVAGQSREVPVASLKSVETQRFDVIGDETLMTPEGPIRALHLRRPNPTGKGDPRIDLWLGYDFEMLPVRLRIEDAGRRVLDQLIERDG